ncbi:MAG: DNA-binding protein [Microbacteriaceae bacterium]|nr:MAG: DNA-binding protein [Microbacteriaceae bacterium]
MSAIATLDEARASKDAVLTVADVSRILGLNPRTVSEEIRQGGIPSIRVGRRILVPRERFLALFQVEGSR